MYRATTITSCYKVEDYLEEFVKRATEQTIFDQIEMLFILNEPTDKEKQILEQAQQDYGENIRYLVVPEVEPLGASWNRGIENAQADKVAIWNVDDLRTPDSLEKQVKYLEEHPDVGVVHGNFVITNEFGKLKGKFIDHSVHRDNPKEFTRSMILGPFFMWRKELKDTVGYFDEQLETGCDFDYAIRLAVRTKIGMVHGVLGYFLDEGKGASTAPNSRQAVERTVIELRYGIVDKLDHSLMPEVNKQKYKVDKIRSFGVDKNVSSSIPNYEQLRMENANQ